MLLLPLLRTAQQNGATSVEVSRMPLGLRFYRDKELLAREPLSIEDFTAIGEALRLAGVRGDRTSDRLTPCGAAKRRRATGRRARGGSPRSSRACVDRAGASP